MTTWWEFSNPIRESHSLIWMWKFKLFRSIEKKLQNLKVKYVFSEPFVKPHPCQVLKTIYKVGCTLNGFPCPLFTVEVKKINVFE